MPDLRLLDVAGSRVSSGIERATLLAYERWAESYPPLPHNPLMRAEQRAMLELWPEISGRQGLDLACGSGRYARLLAATGAERVVALDFSGQMLRQVRTALCVRGRMSRLPFAAGAFDVVICGLAVGHAEDLGAWTVEIARVLVSGGVLLYSDFHPQAARAGHTRCFRDAQGIIHPVPHYRHGVAAHRRAAAAAGFAIEATREVRVGIELREALPESVEYYRRRKGMPVVLVIRARKQ